MSASVNGDRMLAELTRYDIVLLVIPAAFLLALVAGGLLGLPSRVPFVAASLVGALAVGDAMFRNPPIES